MPVALVTGATGFVGSSLIAELHRQGWSVRAYVRESWKGRPLPAAPADIRYGDIRDESALTDAANGCDVVFHTAAVVSFRQADREEQLSVNVGGTRAVASACLKAGAGRLVHTSSVAAVGRRDDGWPADETSPFDWPESITYRWSKHLAEREVIDAVGRGLDAVIVNPAVIVGPGDRYVHGGQLLRDAARGKLIAYPVGGMNVVGIPDVVAGHIAAAAKGRRGERYILGGVNLTHREAFDIAARITGGRRPWLPVPKPAVMAAAGALEILAAVLGREPLITRGMAAGAGRYQWFSILKAGAELGYRPLSLEASMRAACDWYRENNLL